MAGWSMGTEAWIWMGAWAVVMVLVVWLLVWEPRRDTRDDPHVILRIRFARGEITEDEFRRASAALDSELSITPTPGVHHNAAHPHPGQDARHD